MFNKNIGLLFILLSLSFSAVAQKLIDKKAKKIIAACVTAHGGKNYQNIDVSFDFRKYRVHIQNINDLFTYERTTQDSANNTLHDVLNNTGFMRDINGIKQTLSAKEEDKYKEGLNSVAYFVLLPYKLTDASVNSSFIGTITINNQIYDKIKVWFDAEGGGKDHQDVFCYWINQKTHTLDYLAYTMADLGLEKPLSVKPSTA